MGIVAASGAQVYIGPANEVAADKTAFEALTPYVSIGKLIDAGEVGGTYDPIETDHLADRITKTLKGQFKPGSWEITYDHDASDSGQGDVSDAVASDSNFAFKLTLNDEGAGSPSNPTTIYLRGLVMGKPITISTANNVVRRKVMIRLNTIPVEVPAV